MKKIEENHKEREKTDVSRRGFLSKGVAIGASIIAIKSLGATRIDAAEGAPNPMFTNDPVYTESTQTLTNKTISSRYNTLGSDNLYVKEFSPNGTDITDALNDAIAFLTGNNSGGRIVIPRGSWTTLGGHEFGSSISIEGFGVTVNGPIIGTSIQLTKENGFDYVFRISANQSNCSLKNMTIDLGETDYGIGLLMTNHHNTSIVGTNIYFTNLENVQFRFGANGIKVDSLGFEEEATNFECIMNHFERVSFIQCQTSFYCNSINGGYTFDSCYFQLPTSAGTALDCVYMGVLALNNCLFVGVSEPTPHIPPTDGTTILKTTGAYVAIRFHNCQDEGVQYYYQNVDNDYQVPIVFRSCAIQSSFQFNCYGVVVFESCSINITKVGSTDPITMFRDTSTGPAEVYLKGATNFFKHVGTNTVFYDFEHPYSRILYESNESGKVVIKPLSENPPSTGWEINESRGAVNVKAGESSVVVVNNRVNANTLVFAQLRTAVSDGTRITSVVSSLYSFQINLNQNAPTGNVSVAYKIEGENF